MIILRQEIHASREAKATGESANCRASTRDAVVPAWDPCSALLWPQDRRTRHFPATSRHAALDPCQWWEESAPTGLAPRGGAQPFGGAARRTRNQRPGGA